MLDAICIQMIPFYVQQFLILNLVNNSKGPIFSVSKCGKKLCLQSKEELYSVMEARGFYLKNIHILTFIVFMDVYCSKNNDPTSLCNCNNTKNSSSPGRNLEDQETRMQ